MTDTLTFGSLSFDDPWDMPWYTGSASSPTPGLVPRVFPVAIAGHPYAIDFSKYRRTTMQIRRLQTDDSVEPGENSLNATGDWPRAQDNWFLGEGQKFLDNRFAFETVYVHSGESPSVRTRYYRGKGLDPWNEGTLTNLPAQGQKKSTSNTNLLTVATADALFVADGTDVFYSTNPSAATPTWTSTGIHAVLGGSGVITGLATDGHSVFACSAQGLAVTVDTAGTATLLDGSDSFTGGIWYSKGFLLCSLTGRDLQTVAAATSYQGAYAGGTTYSVGQVVVDSGITYVSLIGGNVGNTPASSPSDWVRLLTLIWTHPSLTFKWNTVTDTPSCILVAGNSGPIAFIGALQADAATEGATLAVPITATTMPPGETINDIQYSSGFVLLATSEGIRSATPPNANGIFDINPVITDPGPVNCIAPWQRFCYFGWSNYSTEDEVTPFGVSSSGLGRADLSQYTNAGIPAYATDVMVDGVTASVVSVSMLGGVPYFTIAGLGVYGPTGNAYPAARLETGWIRYGTLEAKILSSINVQHDALLAGQSVTVQIADEFGNVSTLGVSDTVGTTSPDAPFGGNLLVGQRFMVILTLAPGTDATKAPILHNWLGKALVTPVRQDEIICPILLSTNQAGITVNSRPWKFDTLAEFQFLKGLEATGQPVLYQEGAEELQVYIDQVQVAPTGMNKMQVDGSIWFDCLLTVKMISLENSALA